MRVSNSKQSFRKSKQILQSTEPRAKKQVSPLRQRMIGEMELAGLTQGTQQNYIRAVVMLQDHYKIRPDKLTEKQVQAQARLLLELTTVPLRHSPAVLMGDIADEALGQSGPASQDHRVRCPKCGSMNVYRIDTIRRRNPMVLT